MAEEPLLLLMLARERKITASQADTAGAIALKTGTHPVQHLVNSGELNEGQLLHFLSERFSIPIAQLTSISGAALKLVPLKVCVDLHCIPTQVDPDGSLRVVVADPSCITRLDTLKTMTGRSILPMLTTFTQLDAALKAVNRAAQGTRGATTATLIPERPHAPRAGLGLVETPQLKPQARPKQMVRVRVFNRDDQAVTILNEVFAEAVSKGASDIHIEPQAKQIRIRFRFEGALFEVFQAPLELHDQLVVRTKVLAGMDIAERRVPQDGRAKIQVGNETVNLRVNVMPSQYGENLVFRVLRQAALNLDLDQLGLDEEQLRRFRKIVDSPSGMALVTGPTGSGKTTTLYCALNALNQDPSLKITTVEDPIEYNLDGTTQVPVNKDSGLDFAEVLKSLLRQDPDVILVGEIRDLETARVAVQAALTGHLVLSSLHTGDAPSAILRLINMGVEPFAVVGAVTTVVAQRLVRNICKDCMKPYQPSEETLRLLGDDRSYVEGVSLFQGTGCPRCLGGGYRGRSAIFEVLELDDTLKEMLLKGETLVALKRYLREQGGMTTLRQSALRLAAKGVTTLEEAIATTLDH